MGLESGPQRGITIEPRSLIAAADPNVVTPTAVEALTDAFRKGVVTVDDISARRDQAEQRKMQLAQMQQEAAFNSDPQIVEAKRAAAIAHGSVAKAAAARADSDLKLAPLAEQLDRASKVKAIFENEALSPIEQTTTAFGLLGLSVPKRSDGTVDIEATRPIRARFDEYTKKLQRLTALTAYHSSEKENVTLANGKSTETTFKLNALGDRIDDADIKERDRLQALGFQGYLAQPNAPAAPAAAPAPTVEPIEATPAAPAESSDPETWLFQTLGDKGQDSKSVNFALETLRNNGGTMEEAKRLADAFSINSPPVVAQPPPALIQPKAAPAAAPKADIFPVTPGTPSLPGQQGRVTSIKEAPVKVISEKPIPSEGVKELALARQAVGIGERLKQRYEDLVKSEPNLVGFLQGRVSSWTASRQWSEKVAAFERDSTAILAPLAKGIYNETGVLSDKDIERYRSVIPDIRDNPKVGVQKANDLLGEVFQSYANKVETWKQAGYDAGGFDKLASENLSKLDKLRSETGSTKAKPAAAAPAHKTTTVGGRTFGLSPKGAYYVIP